MQADISKAKYTEIIVDLLSGIDFKMPRLEADPAVEAEVTRRCHPYGLPAGRAEHLAKLGTNAAEWFFPSVPQEVKIALGVYTSHFFAIDDYQEHFADELKNFSMDVVLQRAAGHPIIQSIFDHISDIHELYGWHTSSVAISAMLDYIRSSIAEEEVKDTIQPTLHTPEFPRRFREQTALPAPFAHYVFYSKGKDHVLANYLPLIPDLETFACHVNDILSFYKESIVGSDRHNSAYHRVGFLGKSPEDVLRGLVEEVKVCVARLEKMLDVHPEFRDPVRQFIDGYAAFHLNNPRYLLDQLPIWGHVKWMSGSR